MKRRYVLCLLPALMLSWAGAGGASRQRIAATTPSGPLPLPSGTACPSQPAAPSPPASYRDQTLKNVNLAWRDLRNADFTGATLDGVIFIGADLRGANFSGATFTNTLNGPAAPLPTDFAEANLGSACFIGAKFQTATTRVQMVGADLTCTDLSGTDMTLAVFGPSPKVTPAGSSACATRMAYSTLNCEFVASWASIDLTGSALGTCAALPTSTALVGQDFSGARMQQFNFYEANLQGAIFNNASLTGANLAYTNLVGAKFNGAQMGVAPGSASTLPVTSLVGAYMVGVDLTDADLRSANLAGAHIYGGTATNGGVNFVRTRLDSADLSRALLPGGVFSGSLTNAVFDSAVLANASFNGATLTNAKFNNAYLHGADFSTAKTVNGVSLNNALVSGSSGYWTYTEQDGTPVTYAWGATNLGAIASGSGAFCPNATPSPCSSSAQLTPIAGGPYPPVPSCTPRPKKYDNCLPPRPAS